MLETGSITLIVVLINTITTPLFQCLLHSKCDIIKCCCGLIDIHRVVDLDKLDNELEDDKNSKLGQL
jgi:hypothetical protein